MAEALEQAKAVDQIRMLSQSILEISAQAHLLALNASIEAARAGEQAEDLWLWQMRFANWQMGPSRR